MCPSLSVGTVTKKSFFHHTKFSKIFQKSVTWLIARANAAMTVSQNDIHMIGGRNANGQLLKSVEYCEPGVIGKWKKAIG